ncbi:GntR family transcriptional regulator [Oerskovia sp. M15]
MVSGRWPVGERIPTETDLVSEFEVGRNTVREAIQSLVHAGLLRREQGRGTFVISSSELTGTLERQLAGAAVATTWSCAVPWTAPRPRSRRRVARTPTSSSCASCATDGKRSGRPAIATSERRRPRPAPRDRGGDAQPSLPAALHQHARGLRRPHA